MKWIPVTVDMPREGMNVLVSSRDGNVMTSAAWLGGEWFTRDGEPWRKAYVKAAAPTYWMPLPARPETEVTR